MRIEYVARASNRQQSWRSLGATKGPLQRHVLYSTYHRQIQGFFGLANMLDPLDGPMPAGAAIA
jgi:hypothetical protein